MTRRTVLAVSPHLDDAALSIGATLAELNASAFDVHVLTLFTAVPPGPMSLAARMFHRNCGLPCDSSTEPVRRCEDEEAMCELGATPHHAGLPDAVYRRRPDGEWLCQHERGMFDEALPAEPRVLLEVEDAVQSLAQQLRPSLVLTCAAAGGHVDHRITKSSVLGVAGALDLRVLLWEDLPYAVGEVVATSGRSALTRFPRPQAWDAKWRAVARYSSQTRMLWPPELDWRAVLERHARHRGDDHRAELLWNPGPHDVSRTDHLTSEMPDG